MAITISVTAGSGYAGSTYTQTGAAGAGNWYADEDAIAGATGNTHVMLAANEGKAITFRTASPNEVSNKIKLFVPKQVGALSFQFDAYRSDLMTFNSNKVANWSSSVSALALAQATDANRPTWSATGRNSRPAVAGNGTSLFMQLNTPAALPQGTDPSWMACVAYHPNSNSGAWTGLFVYGTSSVTTARQISKQDSTDKAGISLGSSASHTFPASASTWLGNDKIVIGNFVSGTLVPFNARVNGQFFGNSGNVTLNTPVPTIAQLFRFTNNSGYWPGSVQELLCGSGNLSTTQAEQIEGYFAHKWGLTSLLPTGHTYKNAAPLADTFAGNGILGALVGEGVLTSPIDVAIDATLGALEASATMVEIFDVAGDITLGALVGESTITAVTSIEVEGTLGALEGSSELTAMVHTEVDGTLGALIGESILTQTLPPGELEVLGFLGGLVGEAALTITPEVDVVVEGLLGSLVGEAELVIPENISVNIEAIFGGLIGESILDEDLPGWLEVEDGTIVPNANSYVRQDYVDNYLSIQGYTDYLAATQDEKQGAIVRATSALEAIYGDRYPGEPVNGRLQSLLWPRKGATDVDGEEIAENEIPVELKRASAEAAYLEWLQPGYLTPNWTPDQLVKSEKLGPLSVTYSDPAAFGRGGNKPTLAKIDSIMSGLLGAPNSLLFGTVERV